ncbi:MAG TPA: hypothetical protein VN442_05225 [Bryobacteraceae bacterium]|nr:hypothetical protein [Bryobacteraceae bacterium]
MRSWAAAAFAVVSVIPLGAADKLTFEDRVELTRGLTAEYATVKQFLPRSKKALPFEADGTYDRQKWTDVGQEYGPAARVGDLVQVTKIEIGDDKITLQINGGFKGGRKWYERVQVGGGMGGTGNTRPIAGGSGTNSPGGTTIEILFHKPLEPMKSADVKKILAPVLDFEKRSATQVYAETLPPEIKQAVAEKKAIEGMDREQVLLAMGRPKHKSRETKDGMELEDWVYGQPPGRIVFVTFNGDKVIRVKEAYAGLGTQVGNPQTPR